ncbi:hypothetical protein A1OW_15710 [Enterovibrio norvegicus]|nr:hypothetical protein [Enterovibrio norvegicus]OEF48429.1 hypothetical protein A1OW_15710 [Enterovibrio norvegicus]OEF57865.1 hypothetical protein A1OU_06545 [Enterovibrio norvegicus]
MMMLSLFANNSMAVEYVFLSSTAPFQALVEGLSPRGNNHNIMSAARRESPSSVLVGVVPSDEERMIQSFPPIANNGHFTTVRVNFSNSLQSSAESYRFAYEQRTASLIAMSDQFAAVAGLLSIDNIRTPQATAFTQSILGVADYSPRLMAAQLTLLELLELEEAYRRALARPYATYMYSQIHPESVIQVSQWVWNREHNAWRRGLHYTVPSGAVTQTPVAASLNPVENQPQMGSIGFNVSLPQIHDLDDFLENLEQPTDVMTACTLPYSSSSRVIRSLSELFPCEGYSMNYFGYFHTKFVVAANSTFFF